MWGDPCTGEFGGSPHPGKGARTAAVSSSYGNCDKPLPLTFCRARPTLPYLNVVFPGNKIREYLNSWFISVVVIEF